MRQTLPKSIILRGYQSFSTVITGGTPLHGKLLTGFLLSDQSAAGAKIGFSVPKKRVPLAADRNRIRRLMRESVRRHFGEVCQRISAVSTGIKIVVMYKGGASVDIRRLTLSDIEPEWITLQQQILRSL